MSSNSCTKITTSRSLLALLLRAWSLCVLLVVVTALLLVSPAAVVILLPVACMAVSACLLCAIAARILLPFLILPPDQDLPCGEHQSSVREWKQDCVEVDRAEAPGSLDDDASFAESEEGHLGEGEVPEQEHALGFSCSDEECSDPCCDDEQPRIFVVDTGSYCRTFYDLLAFWRIMERGATGGVRNAQYMGL